MTANDVIAHVAEYRGILAPQIKGYGRHADVAMARAEAAWLLRVELRMSFPSIGAALHKDHSTIIAACKKIEARVESRSGYLEELDEILRGARRPINFRQAILESRAAFVGALEAA